MNNIINQYVTISKVVNVITLQKAVDLPIVEGYYFLYTLKYLDYTGTYITLLQEGSTTGTETLILPHDARYKLEISIPNVEESIIVGFYSFNSLRARVVENIQNLLCSTCQSCDPCAKSFCEKYQNVYADILIYKSYLRGLFENNEIAVNTTLEQFIQTSFDLDIDNILTLYRDDLLEVTLTGNISTNIKRLKYNLTIIYLAMYYYEKQGVSIVDLPTVDAEYKYQEIKKCLCLPNNVDVYQEIFNNLGNVNIEPLPLSAGFSEVWQGQSNTTILTAADLVQSYIDDTPSFVAGLVLLDIMDTFQTAQPITLDRIGRFYILVKEIPNIEDRTLSITDGADEILDSDFVFHKDVANSSILAVSTNVFSYGTLYFKLILK